MVQAKLTAVRTLVRLRIAKPTRPKPRSIIAHVVGSGTEGEGSLETLSVALDALAKTPV